MMLDRQTLDQLLVNKYLVVVAGKLTQNDRSTILGGLNIYNREKFYVGESHIEPFYCRNISRGLCATMGIPEDTTAVIFFRNGFPEYKVFGKGDLFVDSEHFYWAVIEKLGIQL